MVLGGRRTTAIAHRLWESVVRPGDTVVDATCGNGHDALQLARLAISGRDPGQEMAGRLVGFDIQQAALDSTRHLLGRSLRSAEMERVTLVHSCHSKLVDFVPPASASLVAFNLGYLPGGNKEVITRNGTTLKALAAATVVVAPGGLISIIAYIGHPGGREEYERIKSFSAEFAPEEWVCSHHEFLNRPIASRLIFLYKRPSRPDEEFGT
eukprot:SM000029S10535  [mRNA]  locus=s29:633725:635343:- [translate_table: standard]